MLRLAHVRQSCSSRALLLPLHNLNSLNVRTVDFIPHFHAHSRKLVSEENGRLDTSAADVDAYSSKRVARLQSHEKDVANFGCFGFGFGEESGSRSGWIEHCDLVGVKGANRVFEEGGG